MRRDVNYYLRADLTDPRVRDDHSAEDVASLLAISPDVVQEHRLALASVGMVDHWRRQAMVHLLRMEAACHG